MDITIDLFDKICRACLCQSANMKCLLTKTEENRSLVDMFCYVGDIKMNLDDMLPKQVCNDCEVLLKKVDAFKRLCLSSDSQLKKIYNEYIKLTIFQEKKPTKDKTESKSKLLLTESPNASDGFENDTKSVELNNYLFTNTEVSSKIENTNKADVKIEFDNELDSLENDFDDEISQPESSYTTDLIHCQCGLVLSDPQTYKFHLSITNCDKIRKPKRKWVKSETEQEIICQRCDKQFKNPTLWKKHYLTNCDEASIPENSKDFINYQCSICSAKYKSKKTLALHIRRLHKAPTSYKCERCNREFKHKAFLDNHIVSVHINDQVTCAYCNKQCLTQEDLEKHREEHIEKKHQCTTCKKVFTMACTLKEHLRTHTGEKPFLCSFCGKGFSQKHNLQQHVMRHQGNKPFKCKSCEKRFVSKGELEAHTRKHSGAHPFICDDCGNGFTTSSSLFKHRRIHTGERPYKCDLCPMRFIASGTLKNHRRTHTGERPYQCSHCDKAFVQRNDLVSHIRCHTGERPYSCDHCGQGFRKATGLKVHLKVHGKRDDAFRTGGV